MGTRMGWLPLDPAASPSQRASLGGLRVLSLAARGVSVWTVTGSRPQEGGMAPSLPALCSQCPLGHGAQGSGQRCANPCPNCSTGGSGGIGCGTRVGSPAGTGIWENLGRPVLGYSHLCSRREGLVLAGGSAVLWWGEGSPRRPVPRAAQVSQVDLTLSSGHSAGGVTGRSKP